MQFKTRFQIPFMRWRRAGLAGSALLTVISLAILSISWLNVGIDFAGGSLWSLQFSEAVSEQELIDIFSEHGLDNPLVQNVGQSTQGQTTTEFVVRTRSTGEEKRQVVLDALQQKLGEFTLLSFDDVSPSIGREIQANALKALVAAVIGMIVYITIRFEYRFAITAIVALLHDIIIVIGLYALFRFEVDTTFVAAILTVFGYSVNDTIIVYDRIRENRRHYRRDQLEELVNDSVNQTLTRTINTGISTLLAIGALAILGGETIRPFAIALLVGIAIGTFSTIFVASALWLEWALRGSGRRQAATPS